MVHTNNHQGGSLTTTALFGIAESDLRQSPHSTLPVILCLPCNDTQQQVVKGLGHCQSPASCITSQCSPINELRR
ncbi:hypothetical protein E2C01_037767 [Portunus trituberculatus]|uniref:Uncharacterized protein n=1 Tax=Portunus trituberculatus TaxID=210409 RepID=A0A5B7FG62_PORTR|nr:hypothetical protein [Portunus trituberculatus]